MIALATRGEEDERLAVLDLVEELPKVLQDKSMKVAPWLTADSVVVQG